MSKVFIEETTLTAIGDAIRAKEGTTELVPVSDMATRISAISGGGEGGYEPPEEAFNITGDCSYRFASGGWNWFIEDFESRITTSNINKTFNMFTNCNTLTNIPFTINVNNCYYFSYMFNSCEKLNSSPKIRGAINWSASTTFDNLLYQCNNLRDIEDLFEPTMLDGFSTVKVTSGYSAISPLRLNYMFSLRTIPSWWYKQRLNEESTAYPAYTKFLYYNMIPSCYCLDEAVDIPVWRCTANLTSNTFSGTFSQCYRLKDATFETDNGTPYVVNWKSQTIDLSSYVGYANYSGNIVNHNSGITNDKEVYTSDLYQSLKDDPDWFACTLGYSRYNHDSAVNTINSLPDTSAYLATDGGTNTIKFKGESGSLTDGGAINTLTEEEIAVATAKGWTVTLV